MENDNLLNLLFPQGVPSHWNDDSNFNDYISKLGTFKVDDLSKQTQHLQEDKNTILEQTQDLAVSNYRVFIETAECSKQVFSQFHSVEKRLEDLLKDIPNFERKCQQFCEESSGINNLRKLNTLTLTKNAQLLEILELPQLMNSFISDGMYEDALELASYVRKLYAKHPEVPIFKSIVDDVNQAWVRMLHQLLNKLKQDLSLPNCLQLVSHLRRMEIFNEIELRVKFLQSRNTYLQCCLRSIPVDDANYLNKIIETTRVNLFNVITQYRAIFNDDEHNPLAFKSQSINQNVIFFSWISDKISEFLETLEEGIQAENISIESILGQCMYFGLSFSKIGCDFRPLLIPIFTKQIATNFREAILTAKLDFELNMEKFTLINKNHPNVPWKNKSEDPLQAPETLLEFYPLAEFLNQVLKAFNVLRLCAPIAIITDVMKSLEETLLFLSNSILALHHQEHQAFSSSAKDAFTRLCMCFADDMIPYIQKCIHVIYPPSNVASTLGLSVQILQNEGILFLKKTEIVKPIQHLLPKRIKAVLANLKPLESVNKKEVASEESADTAVIFAVEEK